jgi:electron transfer flavoprotein beta subunit
MKAKKKPLETLKPEDLSVDVTPRLEILGMSEPAPRVGGGKVANVEELVARLKKDGLA